MALDNKAKRPPQAKPPGETPQRLISSKAIKPAPDPFEAGRICRVLLVDNEARFATTLSVFAENNHVMLKAAASAEEAAKTLKRDSFDVVIIKANLPDKSGEKGIAEGLAFTIKNHFPQVFVVLATLGNIPPKEKWAEGADFFCKKGDLLAKLTEIIRLAKEKRDAAGG